MRVRHSKLLALIGAGILAVTALVACGNGDAATAQPSAVESSAAESTVAESSAAAPAETTTDLSGSISMVGSTSMEKLANALSEAFMEEHPDVTVTAEFVGSGAGIEAVTNGTTDIGNSSRSLKDEEKAAGVVENVVAIDGIAVCVDPANEVADLTKEQLTNIYNGTVTNWKEVGGADEPIIVIGREAGSGTRDGFESITKTKDSCVLSQELTSTGAVIEAVKSNPNAIGYASLSAVEGKEGIKAITVDGVVCSEATILDGSYQIQRPFVMVTNGGELSEAAQAFLDFATSADAKDLISSAGAVPAAK